MCVYAMLCNSIDLTKQWLGDGSESVCVQVLSLLKIKGS